VTVLLLLHRWLGIAGGALFVLWFASGIAMMYVRMPEVTAAERLACAAPIDPARVRVGLDAAARAAAAAPDAAVALRMLGARPVYAFGVAGTTVFADDGSVLAAVTADDALAFGQVFLGPGSAPLSYGELVALPDQWTLQNRAHLPLHRLRAEDVAGTDVYVSSVTGEVVMQTTGRSRGLAYLGPVPHWLYLPVLRRNGSLWSQVVVALSALGCVACLSGLAVGVWRLSAGRRYRRDGRPTITPYSGWLRWHHYAGLAFGVVTFTWTFSGMLSMDPFPQLSTGGATPAQRQAVEGADTGLDGEALDAATVAAGVSAAAARLSPRELVLARVAGRRYWIASETPDRSVLVAADRPGGPAIERFPSAEIEALGRAAAPAPIADVVWLDGDDGYYRSRDAPRPLPVLRIRSGDRDGTWVYLDPRTGSIVQVLRRPDRVNRWLYHGLHSLDAAWLWHRRPLWDVTVIGLSLGGLALALTSATPGWRRVWKLLASVPARVYRQKTRGNRVLE
jgi:hypothetical protein